MDLRYSSPPDADAYNLTVWEIVRQIPPGKVATYGQIANLIPPPEGMDPAEYAVYRSRWVGSAMRRSPGDVPWQRVINAQGKISLSDPALQTRQRELLEAEGVPFDQRQRVDLVRYGWEGPPPEWLRSRQLGPGEE